MRFLKFFKKLASKSSHRNFHHAAIAMRGGSVAGIGVNSGNTHAEVAALRNIWPNRRAGLKIISVRLTKAGKFANAKPCADCQRFLKNNGVKTVWYSDCDSRMQMMRLV